MEYFIGRVYKIQIKDDFKKSSNMLSLEQKEFVDSIYIGSTKNSLKKRFKHHKQISKNRCTTLIFVELFGLHNMEIILIKEYTVSDEKHLYMYETLHMNKFRLNNIKLINKQASFRIEIYYVKDYRLNHLESKKHREIFNIQEEYKFKCEPCKYYQNQEKLFNRHLKTKKHKLLSGL